MNIRLQQFLAAENISQAQLADSLNVARAGISHILAGRNKPSYDFMTSLLSKYPKLNIEWLMFGKGKMYKDEAEIPQPAVQTQAVPDKNNVQESLFDDYDIEEEENFTSSLEIKPLDIPTQKIDKQRNVKKIIILFDDGTFQEM